MSMKENMEEIKEIKLPAVSPDLVERFLKQLADLFGTGRKSKVYGSKGKEIDWRRFLTNPQRALVRRVKGELGGELSDIYLIVDISGSIEAIKKGMEEFFPAFMSLIVKAIRISGKEINLHLCWFGDNFKEVLKTGPETSIEEIEQGISEVVSRIGSEGTDIYNAMEQLRNMVELDNKKKFAIVLTDGQDLSKKKIEDWQRLMDEVYKKGVDVLFCGFRDKHVEDMDSYPWAYTIVSGRSREMLSGLINAFIEMGRYVRQGVSIPKGRLGKLQVEGAPRSKSAASKKAELSNLFLRVASDFKKRQVDSEELREVERNIIVLLKNLGLGQDGFYEMVESIKMVSKENEINLDRLLEISQPGEILSAIGEEELAQIVEGKNWKGMTEFLRELGIEEELEFLKENKVSDWKRLIALCKTIARKNLSWKMTVEQESGHTLRRLFFTLAIGLMNDKVSVEDVSLSNTPILQTSPAPGGVLYYSVEVE